MAVQVTIIGLGQMGSSIGLALAAHQEKIQRTGHDMDADATRAAQKAGAVDSIHFNLPASVEQADVVVLSLPLSEVRTTLDFIRADLKEGAVVLDLSPAKRQGEAWAREILPAGRYYIGLVPAINPVRLLETGGGLDGARADLFQGATCLVCPQSGIPESAVRLATDFVLLLGATPIISDASEADGLLAAMVSLPKLLAVSLVDATMDKPGWRDAQNLAGRSYAMPVAAAFDRDEADGLRESALANRDNLVRVLDGYIASLRELRDTIQNEERDRLDQKIRAAQDKAYDWLAERHLEKYRITEKMNNERSIPNTSFGARLRQSFFGSFSNPDRDKK
jgi:prephenate dehydrogenase